MNPNGILDDNFTTYSAHNYILVTQMYKWFRDTQHN